MGQSPSSVRSKSGRQRSFRGFVRRSKLNKSSLSHTFSLPPSEDYPDLMNINTATEEQLMTLPGVSRQLARAIVLHRQMIGRFKRVDDLALVSGLGADKLELLRPEICANTKKALSRASSCTQSLDSVRVNSDSRLCSVNSASVFQLQCVPGLNQEIAANIVDHRNKKGPFKSLDDLIKVRGMDIVRLSTVKHHLSLEPRKCESVQQLTNGHVNEWSSLNGSLHNGLSASTPKSTHRKSLSMPMRFPVTLPNGFATAPVNDILDLLTAYSHRPIIEEDFQYEREGVRCCRLGSWNLSQLTVDKINNPGVREVICMTILENKLSLVAIQEVLEEETLRILCDELNSPHLRRVKEWKCNSRKWEYCRSESNYCRTLGFIYDAASKASITIEDLEIDQILLLVEENETRRRFVEELVRLQEIGEDCSVACQAFLINGRPMVVLNIQCRSVLSGDSVTRLTDVSVLGQAAGLPVTLLGDFHSWVNVRLLEPAYQSLLTDSIQTNIDPNSAGQTSVLCGDAIDKTNFNGMAGAVRSGLSHLAIPRGWSWGGPASPYCPVWAEYNIPD